MSLLLLLPVMIVRLGRGQDIYGHHQNWCCTILIDFIDVLVLLVFAETKVQTNKDKCPVLESQHDFTHVSASLMQTLLCENGPST